MRFFLIIIYFYNDYKVSTLYGKNKFIEIFCGKSIYFASFFIMKYICNVKIKRNMKKRELIFFAALATFLSANAQEKQTWSLEDCINYALGRNIQLQQNKIPYRKAKWM